MAREVKIDGEETVYQVFLIDVDSISQIKRDECAMTRHYSPSFLIEGE